MTSQLNTSPRSSPPLPSSPIMDMSGLARLSESVWNTKSTATPTKIISTVRPVKLSSKIDLFSSDPITSTDFGANHLFNKTPFSELPRKRGISTTNTYASQPSKIVKISAPCTIKHTFDTAIFEARDLLVKAYGLTTEKIKQEAVLDMIQVFRTFIQEERVLTTKPLDQNIQPVPEITEIIPEATPAPTYAQKLKEGVPETLITRPAVIKPAMRVLSRQNPTQTTPQQELNPQTKTTPTTTPITSIPIETAKMTHPIAVAYHADSENVITLVTKAGCRLPNYAAFDIRERINKILGKNAISRVHTSPKGNLVLSCMDSTPAELITDQEKWEGEFAGWPIKQAQKVDNWPKLVVHGVATCIPINQLNSEIETFNKGIKTQGEPRWLARTPQNMTRASVAFCVTNEEEKTQLIKSGVLIGGQLLKVVNFQQSTQKTQCQKCLKYGHHSSTCQKAPMCAICLGGHFTSNHKCATCSSTQSCVHHAVQCANCRSNTHMAFQRTECDYYKAISC